VPHSTARLATLAVAVVILGLVTPTAGTAQQAARGAAADHPELRAAFDADQADRRPNPAWRGTIPVALRDSVFAAVSGRDAARRARVRRLIADHAARTARDYYHAAMVLQHGPDSTDFREAHELAGQAVALDSAAHASVSQAVPVDSVSGEARYLYAASWDRYLRSVGRPQWYGTQFVGRPGQPWRLEDIDTTRVTDAERRRLHVPTLAEQRARVAQMNAGASGRP
jgi:hypothetical protein